MYEYPEIMHQVKVDRGNTCETFWSEALGCTVVIIMDEDGVSVNLVDKVVVHRMIGGD